MVELAPSEALTILTGILQLSPGQEGTWNSSGWICDQHANDSTNANDSPNGEIYHRKAR